MCGKEKSAAFLCESQILAEFIRRLVITEPEASHIRWKFYTDFFEFSTPESAIHGTAGFEIATILRKTIVDRLFEPGTTYRDTGLISPASSCTFIQMGMADALSGVRSGDGDKSPDFSLAFAQIEGRRFLVGEVGYSDDGNFTRARVEKWLDEGSGDVLIQIEEGN